MKQNRFVIISTCYNVDPYVQMNIYVNKFQSYDNALFVYVDDKSTDNTYQSLIEHTKDDDRFIVLQNDNNGSQGKSYYYAVDYLKKHDLSNSFVLQYLNQIYQNDDIWMTYGHYQAWPQGNLGGHYHMHIDDRVDEVNAHRQVAFPYSHLKTYKFWLFNKINKKDLIDPTTNEIFSAAWDHALCLPMVEMAGKKHIYRTNDILYVLNRSENLQNEGKLRQTLQKDVEQRCRNLKPYDKIHKDYITCNLLGPGNPGGIPNFGLGNMLFQIATISSLAKDNNAIATFPDIGRPEYGSYSTSLLDKIYIKPPNINLISNAESSFDYHDLKYIPNSIYKGYFQSEKYFKHNRDYILNLFKNQNIIKQIQKLYPNISNNSISLHVRRGDYINLSEFHPLQTIDYYNQAIEFIGSYKNIFVFSDDIEWCKQNLTYDNMIFVEKQTDVFDLIAMSLCSNNIIANSTFSWWGAWLNENPNKVVIAPKNWFGIKRNLDDSNIVPESWIKI
jgi:hypothetical protein